MQGSFSPYPPSTTLARPLQIRQHNATQMMAETGKEQAQRT